MTPSESQPPDAERPSSAEDAYARLLALRESGTAPDFEAWVRQFPEFEAELRELDGSWERVERVLGSTVLLPPPLAPGLQRGARVGGFVLERLIGAGGMGVVWLARQPSLDREVALKFMRGDRETALSPELFEREARAAGRANDRRLVTVYAVGESGGRRWLAMEYVAGRRSLATWLGELRAAGAPQGHARRAAAFVADVAEALHAAHELGVVHRDVKPQNVLIAPDGTPKLTDFGLARLMDEEALSETLTIRGTVEYMSPEQVTGDARALDRKSDVFSLGILLYELLTLERPFTGVTPIEVITRIAAREPRPPSALVPGLEPELDVIVAKALEKRPEERYASAQDLARDLRRWLAHEPIAARRASAWRRLVKWARRRPTAAAIGIGGLLLILSVAVGWRIYTVGKHNELQGQLALLMKQSLWDIDDGRVDSAAGLLAEFSALAPQDPEPHLVAAMGYARYLRFAEAEAELRRAMALGFEPTLGEDPTGRELYLRGLWLLAQRDQALGAEAEALLTRAVERGDGLEYVWFPLYQLRRELRDPAGARAALVEFLASLPANEDFHAIGEALLAELDGRFDAAVASYGELRAKVDDERARELRLPRHHGHAYLRWYLQEPGTRTERIVLSRDALLEAVDQFPDDGNAWASLALAHKYLADLSPDADERERLRAAAQEYAERAVELGNGEKVGVEVQAMLARDRYAADFNPKSSSEDELDELEGWLDRVRDNEPQSPLVPILESYVAYCRGSFAFARGDKALAAEYWEDSVLAYDSQLYARTLLAQRRYYDEQDYEGALELLEQALELWDSHTYGVPGWDPTQQRKWLFATTVWIYGCADKVGNLDLALRMKERVLRELELDDADAKPEETLTFAEFLALPQHEELKDCTQALAILEEYDLDDYWGARPAGRPTLDCIHVACD